MPEVRPDRAKMVALNYRKSGLSQNDFDQYWQNQHAAAFSSMQVVKENLLKYEQYHRNTEQVKSLERIGFQISDFDGLAVFEAESYEKILAVFTSEEYRTKAVPDEEKFLDRSRTTCFPADIVPVLDQ